MISATELKRLAEGRLEDAKVLLTGARYDGAVYVCGYSIEFALKASICKHMQWTDFPDHDKKYSSLKVHDLDVLLSFSGKEMQIKSQYLADWSIVAQWEPGLRYRRMDTATPADAQSMILSATALLKVLL